MSAAFLYTFHTISLHFLRLYEKDASTHLFAWVNHDKFLRTLFCIFLEVSQVLGRRIYIPEVKGPAWEELPHLQGAAAVRAQEGWEELLHVQGQEGRLWGDSPPPR